MPWGVVAGAALGLVGSSMQADAAGNAAETQANSTAAGIAEQRRQADRAYADQAQYRETGGRALTALESDINGAPSAADVMSDPGYKFGLDQGQQGLDRKVAAGGGRVSGAALKAASEYATSYASTGYNAAYQRRQDRLNRLASLAGIGQSSTAASAASGQNAANNITGLISSQGDAAAAGQLAQGNIWGNATNQLGAVASKWINTPSANTDVNTWRGSSFNDSSNYG